MNNDYAKRIAEAVIEAAVTVVKERAATDEIFVANAADAIRSLDLDAIIASVPGPHALAFAESVLQEALKMPSEVEAVKYYRYKMACTLREAFDTVRAKYNSKESHEQD